MKWRFRAIGELGKIPFIVRVGGPVGYTLWYWNMACWKVIYSCVFSSKTENHQTEQWIFSCKGLVTREYSSVSEPWRTNILLLGDSCCGICVRRCFILFDGILVGDGKIELKVDDWKSFQVLVMGCSKRLFEILPRWTRKRNPCWSAEVLCRALNDARWTSPVDAYWIFNLLGEIHWGYWGTHRTCPQIGWRSWKRPAVENLLSIWVDSSLLMKRWPASQPKWVLG